MPATNYTPIQLYRTTTSGTEPVAGNMNPGEIALNIADNDMSMWMENASGTVKRFFNNPAALKYPTADGTSGQVLKTDGAGNLSFGNAAGGALTNNTRQAVTSSSTTTIDLNSGNVIDLTMAASIATLSFTNVPASGTPILIQIVVKNASDGTAYTIAWPNSVYWSGQYAATTVATAQTAPTLATGANGVTVIALLTTDGGTKWRGWVEATIPGGALNALYASGSNDDGQLGQNNTSTPKSSPIQVGALTNWAIAEAGTRCCVAIKTDGTLWSWGYGITGRLGQNSIASISSPTQVGSLTNWSSVSVGKYTAAAIKTDGTLWVWGRNYDGNLGLTDRVVRSSPTQVGALSNWASVSMWRNFGAAIKTDGTLWTWGNNNYGQLGNSNKIFRSSPVQVGASTSWLKVAAKAGFCAAIRSGNSLWTWGANGNGELGLNGSGAAAYRSSPVQVGALTDWASVAPGSYACTAVKTDGTLWTWGKNSNGSLGQGDTVSRSSPVQVGALTNWAVTSFGIYNCVAVKTDGTLWSWGRNNYGQLGQNNNQYSSSPVQVGASTNWILPSIQELNSFVTGGQSVNPA